MSILDGYSYSWPREPWETASAWSIEREGLFRVREMPEDAGELERDSRWPAFFPAPLCLVTTTDGRHTALEKVVGASIVNRFPYVLALSCCRTHLSPRHHARGRFSAILERGGQAAVQFLPPGPALERVMRVVTSTGDASTTERLAGIGAAVRPARTLDCPVFDDAYLVYETRLVRPTRDLEGAAIFDQPWLDVGSHRVYFLEITAIQLRSDIARGAAQIRWRSLPTWVPADPRESGTLRRRAPRPVPPVEPVRHLRYQKGFDANYTFPSPTTVAFAADEIADGRAVQYLPPVARDQLELDNDRARWPCFFPSSVGMITSQAGGPPNVMPCGSTTILSRHPLVVAPAVSYAAINQRYAQRASLEIIRTSGRFGCGVPYASEAVLAAIRYAGNVSHAADRDKIANAGLTVTGGTRTPRLADLPVHFECEVTGEVRLGTHVLFLGEVRSLSVRRDVTAENPVRWVPWAWVNEVLAEELCG